MYLITRYVISQVFGAHVIEGLVVIHCGDFVRIFIWVGLLLLSYLKFSEFMLAMIISSLSELSNFTTVK